jgi:Sulfotransferase family
MGSAVLPSPGSAQPDAGLETEAVVVVGYLYSGSALFREAVAAQDGPAWIDAPGLVSTTYQLGSLWQRMDGRPGGMSMLSAVARKSIRSLLQTMLIARLIRDGARTWVAGAVPLPQEALDFFAEIFGGVKFVCLYREFDDFVTSTMVSHRWGIAGTGMGFDKFAMEYPWNPVAALTKYWIGHTEALANFERNHPDKCLRVHYSDLIVQPERVMSRFQEFTKWELRPWPTVGAGHREAGLAVAGDLARVPRERIPEELLGKVGTLMAEIGY